MVNEDLQLRLCNEDSGTGSGLMVSVKRERDCDDDEDDDDEDEIRERRPPSLLIDQRRNGVQPETNGYHIEEDGHRLRIKESVTMDTVFDGGGCRRSPSQDVSDLISSIKSETSRHSPAHSVSSSDAAVPSPGPVSDRHHHHHHHHNQHDSINNNHHNNNNSSNNNNIRPWTNGPAHQSNGRPDIIFSHRRGISDSPATPTSNSGPSPPPLSSRSLEGNETGRATSRVPSVILGQSGGVKTMVWTGHWADQQQQQNNVTTTPSRPRSVPAGSDPPPAQLLSNGGQPVGRPNSVANGAIVKLGHISNNRLDNNDPSIRLSVDGLLSLAQSSAERRHSAASSRSSPSQVIFQYNYLVFLFSIENN